MYIAVLVMQVWKPDVAEEAIRSKKYSTEPHSHVADVYTADIDACCEISYANHA